MNKEWIEIANGMNITEPVISKIHRKCHRATFDMKLSETMSMVVEVDAPSPERLQEKINHLKETGIILRN